MTDNNPKSGDIESGESLLKGKFVSRREFLKIAGVAGATVGVGGGLGGLLAACGGGETITTAGPTTTAAGSTTTGGPTTTAAASTTTVSAAETGREIKIGVIAPVTGIYAVFAIAERWGLDLVQKHLGDTMLLGDGKNHKVSWLLRDTQSDSNRAAQVTSDLILTDKVDMCIAGGGPDTVMPTADTCETLGSPLLSVSCPWQAFVFGRGKKIDTVENWVFGHLFGIEQPAGQSVAVVEKIPTNKKVGLFFGNTADTQAWLTPGIGVEDAFKAAGYTTVLPSLFNQGTEDFSDLISAYKKDGCEVNMGSNPGKDFPNFWKQALQQSYHPKVCIEITGLASYEDQVALGDAVYGIIQGLIWHRSYPYTDLITGMTGNQLGDDYEATLNSPSNSFIAGYAKMGWAVDVLKRTKSFDNKEDIVAAIKTTKTELVTGPIDLTSPVDPTGWHVTPNIYKQVWGSCQYEKGTKWKVDQALVAIDAPGVKVDREPIPMAYS